MKEIDATRLKLKAMELAEGTDLKWWNCIRASSTKEVYSYEPYFGGTKERYELAFCIIEGKPVWEGSCGYFHGDAFVVPKGFRISPEFKNNFTWLPSKPKTAMVEFTVDDLEYWNALGKFLDSESYGAAEKAYKEASLRFYNAIRKTLEDLK